MFTNVEKCNLICGVSTKYLIIVKKIYKLSGQEVQKA